MTPALRRRSQEDQEFGDSLGYMRSLRQARTVWNPVLKKKVENKMVMVGLVHFYTRVKQTFSKSNLHEVRIFYFHLFNKYSLDAIVCHHRNFEDHEGPALSSVYSRWLLGNAGVSTTHSWILKAELRAGSVTMVMGRPSYFITPCCPLFAFSLVTVQTFVRLDCVKPFHQSSAWQKARSPAHLGGHEQCFQECGMICRGQKRMAMC